MTSDMYGAVIRAVECYRDLIVSQPTVIVGDFNSNTIWDYKRPETQNHSGLVRLLASLDLVSAYHQFFGETQGKESRPTLFLQRNPAKPYHIDYCFIPRAWASQLRHVEIGADTVWAKESDHRPLLIDIGLSDQTGRAEPLASADARGQVRAAEHGVRPLTLPRYLAR